MGEERHHIINVTEYELLHPTQRCLPQALVYPWTLPKGAWFLQRPKDLHRPRPSQKVPLEGDPRNNFTKKTLLHTEEGDFPTTTEKSFENSSGKELRQDLSKWDLPSVPTSEEAEFSLNATDKNEEEFRHHQETDGQPTSTVETSVDYNLVQEPVVLPVTEGKNRGGHDYGLPKELMPIHPGGGSKFEDLEREKLERAKMAQTKLEDDDKENGNSYDAEGLYSSASLLSFSTHLLGINLCVRIAVYISRSIFLPAYLDSVIFPISVM